MSLLPLLFDDSYLVRPTRLLDQHFGVDLDPEEFLQPLTRMMMRCPAGYIRNWRTPYADQDTGSCVSCDKNKFQANLDVQQFKPDEISVKLSGDNTITIEGKHDEKTDEHGQIFRHFVRKYTVPKGYDIDRIESKLSSDGVLTISAPKEDDQAVEHKSIPITQTGVPAKAVKSKNDKKAEEK